jgi:hypothetical protein
MSIFEIVPRQVAAVSGTKRLLIRTKPSSPDPDLSQHDNEFFLYCHEAQRRTADSRGQRLRHQPEQFDKRGQPSVTGWIAAANQRAQPRSRGPCTVKKSHPLHCREWAMSRPDKRGQVFLSKAMLVAAFAGELGAMEITVSA